ncbi:MAG: hypothetical protein V3S07_10130, partial [Micropepsaceae bacterium]
MEEWIERATEIWEAMGAWFSSPQFYAQLVFASAAYVLAYVIALALKSRIKPAMLGPDEGPGSGLKAFLVKARELIFPLLALILLGIAVQLSAYLVGQDFIVRIGQSLAVVVLLYLIVVNFIQNPAIVYLMRWVGIPIALLQVFGLLDDVTEYLDTVAIVLGNISFSAYDLARTVFFGTILFWLGRVSNETGQQVIRRQSSFDKGTEELLVKLLQISLYSFIFILLLQIVGINLTALTVFGGALGVGLGFGSQQIAA